MKKKTNLNKILFIGILHNCALFTVSDVAINRSRAILCQAAPSSGAMLATCGIRFFSSSMEKDKDLKIPGGSVKPRVGFTKDTRYKCIDVCDFNFDSLRTIFLPLLKEGVKYAFLLKLPREDGGIGMGGTHRLFKYNSREFNDNFYRLYEDLYDLFTEYIKEYFNCEVLYVEVMYVAIAEFPELKTKNINKLVLNKNFVKISDKKLFNNSILPLSPNPYYYGDKIDKLVNKDGKLSVLVDNLNFIDVVNEQPVSISVLINKDGCVNGIDNIDFYLYTKSKVKYIVVTKLVKDSRETEVFNLKGSKIVLASDRIISENEFTRTIRNTSIRIKNGLVTDYKAEYEFPHLEPLKNNLKNVSNTNFGVLDIEAYFNSSMNKSYVYAIGFKLLEGEENLFFLDTKSGQTSDDIVLNCINAMLIKKYHKFIFYVHNFSGYDAYFIINILDNYNDIHKQEYYKLDTIFRNEKVLRLNISIKTKSGSIKISLVDSYSLLQGSLDKLSKEFECNVVKGSFPHSFVNELTLDYVGNTPDKVFYSSKAGTMSVADYSNINKPNWNLKDECLKYLSLDLNSLLEVMNKFNKYMYMNYDLQVTESLTIARLGLNIFLHRYLGKTKLPLINKPDVFNFIKQGYFGGITEVYIPLGEDINYYDVNSEYPFVAKNPMPGNKATYLEDFTGDGLNLDELFGFFYCKVRANTDYIGLLPLHVNGNLILPNGDFYGVWFTAELELAAKNGCEITVLKGYNFNKLENVFSDFVDDLYDKRINSKGVVKAVTKMLLNSPFGRLGMSIFKPKTERVDKAKLDYILSTREVSSLKELNENLFLVSYKNEISRSICEKSGMDYIKVLNNTKGGVETNNRFKDVSITTAAAITAYARVYMNTIKLWILNEGGLIYYMDTDSIVTNIQLPDHLLGDKLGQFKLEHKIKKAYFISSKTYCLELYDGSIVKIAKGVDSNSLCWDDFVNMYLYKKDIKAIKNYAERNYKEGYVNIKQGITMLRHNAYTKREKIFNSDGLWINTKPCVYTTDQNKKIFKVNAEKSLVLYTKPKLDLILQA